MGNELEKFRRPFWRRRWVWAMASLLALVLVVRLMWGWWAARELAVQLEQIRSRGEPVTVGDVVYPWLADAENAFVLQMRAAAAQFSGLSPRNSTLEYAGYPPYPSEWMKLAEKSEKANGQAFALARQARSLTKVQMRQGLSSPVVNTMLPYLSGVKSLASTLADGAAYSQIKGDDGEAVERLLDLWHVARSLRHDDFVVSQLVAIGIEALACDQTMVIGPALRFDSAASTQPATPEKVRQLIDQLLDERSLAHGLRQSLVMDRLMWIDYCRTDAKGVWVIRPLADREIVRENRNVETAIEAAACTTWPAAQAVLKRISGPQNRQGRWFQIWSGDRSPYFERYFRNIAERRTTATALACQLYRQDHARWPLRLDELVPKYLAAAPRDPFHDDGRPLGYAILKGKLPGGGDRPVIFYDAGPDDIGPGDEPAYGWMVDQRAGHHSDVIRQYRDLERFVPPKSK